MAITLTPFISSPPYELCLFRKAGQLRFPRQLQNSYPHSLVLRPCAMPRHYYSSFLLSVLASPRPCAFSSSNKGGLSKNQAKRTKPFSTMSSNLDERHDVAAFPAELPGCQANCNMCLEVFRQAVARSVTGTPHRLDLAARASGTPTIG